MATLEAHLQLLVDERPCGFVASRFENEQHTGYPPNERLGRTVSPVAEMRRVYSLHPRLGGAFRLAPDLAYIPPSS